MASAPAERNEEGEEEIRQSTLTELAIRNAPPVSHNLAGQKIGRKGRLTRERILAAAAELVATEEASQISLSAVARKASLGMTSLYNYFSDFTELMLAVLDPVMATAEDTYIRVVREYWPDDRLDERCLAFVMAYYDFWSEHTRLLHLRNSMADGGDQRMLMHRVAASQPVIRLFMRQMVGDAKPASGAIAGMATVLVTGVDRTITIATDNVMFNLFGTNRRDPVEHFVLPTARLLALAIRDGRSQVAAQSGQ